ncbi:Sensor protein FixL [Novipirellula aureliae]|uniref:histidine kinase n=1 Tax=Novipirellula aureliae TaxID=2527966 RepID=A0A5C6E744_9BACT|nr:PAS domain S-box protein [Novipirellula aureliae]TWU43481.1 Sensor protein FixL [Novipirellula aureliae]
MPQIDDLHASETWSPTVEPFRTQKQLQGHTRVLKQLAGGASLDTILDTLIEFAEELSPDMLASIELVNSSVAHPRLAQTAGLRASWSAPIVSSKGQILGTFAMYACDPQATASCDHAFMSDCVDLAAIAIERFQDVASIKRLAEIVDSTEDGVIRTSIDGIIETWNRGSTRIYGFSEEEAIGQPASIVIPPDHVDEFADILDRVCRGERVDHFETERLTKDGRRISISLTVSPIRDLDGNVIGTSAITKDISELSNARLKLLQTERLAAMGQMVSAIAHESRNALQRIQVGVDMLGFEIQAGSEGAKELDRIDRAKNDLQHLFEELRSFAAPLPLEPCVCSIAQTWRNAWANLEPLRSGREATIVEEIHCDSLNCELDTFRMEQVFRNLFENTLFACCDPVCITIQCADGDVDGAPGLCVRVQDDGPGLTVDQKNRIFEPFFTTKPKGTGLGMAIAQRILKAHRGRITVGHGEGGGAEFLISLPRKHHVANHLLTKNLDR